MSAGRARLGVERHLAERGGGGALLALACGCSCCCCCCCCLHSAAGLVAAAHTHQKSARAAHSSGQHQIEQAVDRSAILFWGGTLLFGLFWLLLGGVGEVSVILLALCLPVLQIAGGVFALVASLPLFREPAAAAAARRNIALMTGYTLAWSLIGGVAMGLGGSLFLAIGAALK